MDSKKIGKLIAKRRKEKGMTQGELAERLSVSNKTISKWETGAGLPDISILVDLASVLDISVDDLLRGKENEVQSALYEKNFLIKNAFTFSIQLIFEANGHTEKRKYEICFSYFKIGYICFGKGTKAT